MNFVVIWKVLSSYGVLGVMCVVLMFVVAKLYRDREAERERHRLEIETFRDRYEQKAEKYADKFAALVAASNNVIESYHRAARERASRDADAPR